MGGILGLLAVFTYLRGTTSRIPLGRRSFLLLLRLIAIALVCIFLFQPMTEESIPRRHPKRVALVAVDSSLSMEEKDGINQASRIDTAKRLLSESGLLGSGESENEIGEVRFFSFDEDARTFAGNNLINLGATGGTTRFHSSMTSVLNTLKTSEYCVGTFVFSDGHDFENVAPGRTSQLARARQAPFFTIPIGKQQTIPDITVNIASFSPYTFVRQTATVQASVRLTGSADPNPIRVELLREGEVIRERKVTPFSGTDTTVAFEVSEDQSGQYEYEIRATPLTGERELGNNSAFTFLNVTDAKIQVLLIEGAPHWDTTFMRRTLGGNSRIELTSVISLGKGKPLLSTTAPADAENPGPLTVPSSEADFRKYPLIILGRDVDRVLEPDAIEAMEKAVTDGGATIVFARGKPGMNVVFDDLSPALWLDNAAGPVRLVSGKSNTTVVPLEVLDSAPGGAEALPNLPIAAQLGETKTLAAVEAMAEDTALQSQSPAFVHRRQGAGQVMAVSVGGLWRWSLNAKSEASNNVYDKFWNQLLLNLIARSNAKPSDRVQLSVSSANIKRGERIHFALHAHPDRPITEMPRLSILLDGEETSILPLNQETPDSPWKGSLVMEKTGRFRGQAQVGNEAVDCRFVVYEEKRETTETTPDFVYLRMLAESSGGQLLDESTLKETVTQLSQAAVLESNAPPIIKRKSAWDNAWVFYLLFGLLGTEWFLRRRWGMV